jgi:metallo-beta-lactamase class B
MPVGALAAAAFRRRYFAQAHQPHAHHRMNTKLRLSALALVASVSSVALTPVAVAVDRNPEWTVSQKPFRLYGNAWYVGTHGLASILITSDKGHVLIDGALPEAAKEIAANVKALGFRVEDIKVILNSHAHFDHAGGIAELQRLSGAKVWASPWSAKVFAQGELPDDPQFGSLEPVAKIANVSVLKDGQTVRVGPIELVAHFTPGHTTGGTSWTWKSCEEERGAPARCLNMVYADSLSAVSAPKFRFTGKADLLKQFDKSFATLTSVPCDILVSPHPSASKFWERVDARDSQGKRDALLDPSACDMYVAAFREGLRKRLAQESAN